MRKNATNEEVFTLFLDGNLKHTAVGNCFSNATQSICLLGAYCKSLNVRVCLVQDQNSLYSDEFQPQLGFSLPEKCFKDVCTIRKKDIPKEISDSNLPSVLSYKKDFVISGLCHILRILIKNSCINSEKEHVRLLGHKKFCLKAAFEVSSRTRLCEVLGPVIIDQWLCDVNARNIEEVPEAIKEFEALLDQPIAIHNRDKRQRVVLKKLVESTSVEGNASIPPDEKIAKIERTKLNRKLVVRTNDLPPLEHVFAEGVELTISDLAMLPFVHSYLTFYQNNTIKLSGIPLLLRWYHRLQNITEVLNAAALCAVSFCKFEKVADRPESSDQHGKHEVLQLGREKKEDSLNCLKKKDLDKTLRRDLPSVLRKIDPLVSVTFKQFLSSFINVQWSSFPTDVHPVKGDLSAKRALRKCQQIENILFAVNCICEDNDVIVDFCAGGGHVGIVLAYILPKCKIVIVDNKEESLDRARSRICSLGLSNVVVYQCNLENYRGAYNVGIALHACGVATDMVLQKCLREKASFVISPCCYGKVQNTDAIEYPQSDQFKKLNVTYQELILLGHGGDQTSWDFDHEKPKQGKHCMGLIDCDRAFAAEEKGFRTFIHTLEPHDCSPKNNLIIGVAPGRLLDAKYHASLSIS